MLPGGAWNMRCGMPLFLQIYRGWIFEMAILLKPYGAIDKAHCALRIRLTVLKI
jgi:hypothetical protein